MASPLLRFALAVAVPAAAFLLGRLGPTTGPAAAPVGPADRRAAAGVALSDPALSPAEFAHRAAGLTGSFAAEDERQRLLGEWAQVDPAGALAFARANLRGDRLAQALSAILSAWGRAEPAAAWAWVERDMPTATHLFDTLLEVFGRQSTPLALQYASTFSATHPSAAAEAHLAALLGVTYRGDYAGAQAFLASPAATANPAVRAAVSNLLAGQWTRFDPAAAREWVLSLPAGEQRDQAYIGYGESLSEINPAAAADFATGLPEGPSRSLAMRQAISKWVVADPVAARTWVITSDARQDFDAAVEAIATQSNLMYRDPGYAFAWATGIFDPQARVRTLGAVLFNWINVDRGGALAALNGSPDLTPGERLELLAALQQAPRP